MPAPKGNQYASGNKGGGRKCTYNAEYAEQASKLCEVGFTDQMLGDFFGVTESTINRWKLEHEEFLRAPHLGKEVADDAVERAVFQAIIAALAQRLLVCRKVNFLENCVYLKVRFISESGHPEHGNQCPLSAISRHPKGRTPTLA